MAQDRAVFWLSVAALIGAGLVFGQLPAIMVGAMTSLLLAHRVDGMFSG